MTSGTPAPPRRGLDGVVAAQTRLSHVNGTAGELIIAGYLPFSYVSKKRAKRATELEAQLPDALRLDVPPRGPVDEAERVQALASATAATDSTPMTAEVRTRFFMVVVSLTGKRLPLR